MLKKDIQKRFKKYIEDLLRKDEIYHLRHKPVNPYAANLEVRGLELRLSDYTEALGMNDFEDFEEDAAYFIDEHFPNHRLKPEDERYRVLVREYMKAAAYYIQVSLKRLQGDYFDEPTCDWMPEHLGSIEGIETEPGNSSAFVTKPGRPGRNWAVILGELNQRQEAGELKDKSRALISRELADWYNEHRQVYVAPDTIRKRLKSEFDSLGL